MGNSNDKVTQKPTQYKPRQPPTQRFPTKPNPIPRNKPLKSPHQRLAKIARSPPDLPAKQDPIIPPTTVSHKTPTFKSFHEEKKEIIHRIKIDFKPKIAIAIDFGSNGLKIAYFANNQIITHNKWKSKKHGDDIIQKTSVLINIDGKVNQFGQDAIDMYLEIPSKQNDWMLFKDFITSLYGGM